MKSITETLYKDFNFSFNVDKILFEEKTDHQHLVIFKNSYFGTVMMLDGVIQVTTKDEFIYHEMMVHVPMLSFNEPKNILIIGGGDGGIAREVLRHNIRHCTQIEIDKSVVDVSLKYLPELSNGAYSDPRFDLIIGDGVEYVKNTNKKFDIIIVDSTDPEGPGKVLFTKDFYTDCHKCLNKGGILVTQNGVLFLQPEQLKKSVDCFKEIFNYGGCYTASIPTYIGGQMAIGFATDDTSLVKISLEVLEKKFKQLNIDTKYYTPEIHKGSFALPNFANKLIK